MSMYRN